MKSNKKIVPSIGRRRNEGANKANPVSIVKLMG